MGEGQPIELCDLCKQAGLGKCAAITSAQIMAGGYSLKQREIIVSEKPELLNTLAFPGCPNIPNIPDAFLDALLGKREQE